MLHESIRDIDFTFTPESYWGVPESLLANIKGVHRKDLIIDSLKKGEPIPAYVMEAEWTPAMADTLMGMHPSFSGGEYLPGYLKGEIEIARIVHTHSVHCDVDSYRARLMLNRIHYRHVNDDEYFNEFSIKPKSSNKILSLGRLINLILSTEPFDNFFDIIYCQYYIEYGAEYHPAVSVQSDFYPDLETYFDALQDQFKRSVKKNEPYEKVLERFIPVNGNVRKV